VPVLPTNVKRTQPDPYLSRTRKQADNKTKIFPSPDREKGDACRAIPHPFTPSNLKICHCEEVVDRRGSLEQIIDNHSDAALASTSACPEQGADASKEPLYLLPPTFVKDQSRATSVELTIAPSCQNTMPSPQHACPERSRREKKFYYLTSRSS
jgi:hypothetical protein